MLLQYAREHHFPNPTFFVDDGVSGVTYDRPGFQAMLAEIEAGCGPMQIANQLKADKVLTPSAYRALQGIKTPNKKPEDPCDWHSSTVVAILERREYTGCTVNFKTYTNSIWDKKQRDNPLEKQAIFPNTHEAIIEEAVFEKVQQVRQQRHRNTRTGRSSIFSGLVYCADCGEKLY